MQRSKFRIRGSAKPLSGSINVQGAKNDALKAFAATILMSEPVVIRNSPNIEDVFRAGELLKKLGARVAKTGARAYKIDASRISRHALDLDIAQSLRASIVFAGPILARMGRVTFPHPGGCVIGKRPIDIFLDGWRAMGARVLKKSDSYLLAASRLYGCDFTFRAISHTGTEALMMTAAIAYGKTVLRNAACEPEVVHLADFLNKAGARIRGAGTHTIEIEGTSGALLSGGEFKTLPDRIEAGCFIILGALCGKNFLVRNCNPAHLAVFLKTLELAGVPIEIGLDCVRVSRPRVIRSVDVKTHEYPGFVTDLQAPYVVFATQAKGATLVFETIFESRLNYVDDLNRMGASIVPCDPHRVLVNGPTQLRGREVESPDIRAGLAFIIAAAIAKGESVIGNTYQIDRGYEAIDKRLRAIGVDIRREKS